MNEKQSQELEVLENLEAAGTLEDAQKDRFEELKALKGLAEKAASADKFQKDFQTAEAQKKHFREKFEAEEKIRKDLEAKSKGGEGTTGLQVDDFIGISASLEGLDQREKEYIATLHKQTGKPLPEIRQDENFLLWQSAYKAKVEKERSTLIPSNKQPDGNADISLEDALNAANNLPFGASLAEKEKLLAETMGFTVGSKPRSDRTNIGR